MHSEGMRTALEITQSVEEVSDADEWCHSTKEMEMAMQLIASVFQDDPHQAALPMNHLWLHHPPLAL
jgi:hypothetical protein